MPYTHACVFNAIQFLQTSVQLHAFDSFLEVPRRQMINIFM
jgi:hypothetical protein